MWFQRQSVKRLKIVVCNQTPTAPDKGLGFMFGFHYLGFRLDRAYAWFSCWLWCLIFFPRHSLHRSHEYLEKVNLSLIWTVKTKWYLFIILLFKVVAKPFFQIIFFFVKHFELHLICLNGATVYKYILTYWSVHDSTRGLTVERKIETDLMWFQMKNQDGFTTHTHTHWFFINRPI